MSGIQGMVKISLEEMRQRVSPPITEICDDWVAKKWNENWLGCQKRYSLKQLEAHRKFLGAEKLTEENLLFLFSCDTAFPTEFPRCHQCHRVIKNPVRWFGITESGVLEQDPSDLSVREYGLTTIIPDGMGRPFVAKFCLVCQVANELTENQRWSSYAKSLTAIAEITARRNAQEAAQYKKEKKAQKAQQAAEASVANITSMLQEDVEVMTEADILPN